MRDPFKVYGFDYVFNGRRYTFTVDAHSDTSAKEQAAAMREFTFVGELKPVEDATQILPRSNDSAQTAVAA